MRNFLLAGNVAAIAASTAIDKAPAGALGFYYMNNGAPTVDATGKLITGYGQIVMGRASKDGGPIIIPFYNKDFSYSKSTYSAAKIFTANFTVPEPVIMCDHTVIFTKKGIQFNERSNWTASIHVFKDTETADQVATKIANYVNNNTATLGLTAAVSTATVTVTATEPAVDYEITMADALSGTTVTYTTRGEIGIADAEAIKKMANMAAADAGFEYTYMDDVHYLYPNYPLNPNTGTNTTDAGYTVYTLRFAVPRDVKTRDELVHQIVQIAIPTGAPQIATMDIILAGIKSVA
jgi:hypothetical protein